MEEFRGVGGMVMMAASLSLAGGWWVTLLEDGAHLGLGRRDDQGGNEEHVGQVGRRKGAGPAAAAPVAIMRRQRVRRVGGGLAGVMGGARG